MLEEHQIAYLRQELCCSIVDGIKVGFEEVGQPTLRDRFAMAALQGLLAQGFIMADVNADWRVECAAESYKIADAMLGARKP